MKKQKLGQEKKAIGIFDSGIGGFSILRAIKKLDPSADIIYYADLANFPYGTKTELQITEYLGEGIKFLQNKETETIVIACNTASLCLKNIEQQKNPIVNTLDAIKKYEKYSNLKVIATAFSANNENFKKMLPQAEFLGLSKLAELIEKYAVQNDTEKIEEFIKNYLIENLKGDLKNVLFACTHFPLIDFIFKNLFPETEFLDFSDEIAKQALQYPYSKKNIQEFHANHYREDLIEKIKKFL